jgi:uncharacterized protein (DUF2126 family)
MQYNGTVTDSGGGGQLTFGGATAESSPFFAAPQLLPRLIRYLLRHPSLSYWFATAYVGGSSQSPRPDEGLPESLAELCIALEQLERTGSPTPHLLWATLRHFLADCSGNPHRSELNIEKLHNPYLPGRGCLGLVEFRAFRMAASAERLTGVALLVRAVMVMLARTDVVATTTHWGPALHDRFALPSQLRHDLGEVFADLTRAGLGLCGPVEAELLRDEERLLGALELDGCRLDVERALEFWPLVGDVASQEAVGARLVDASTARIELRLSAGASDVALDDWDVLVNAYRLPLVRTQASGREARVFGVRYRTFIPMVGLHPSLRAEQRLVIDLIHRPSGAGIRALVFSWRPDGGAYPGLPVSADEAARRRAERFLVTHCPPEERAVAEAPAASLSPFCLDLRRT